MLVTIHQPNFLPWFPFFEKAAKADKFVLLTHCQFERNGYQNRARIGNKVYTMPVKKRKDMAPIIEKEYSDYKRDFSRTLSTLRQRFKSRTVGTLLDNLEHKLHSHLSHGSLAQINSIIISTMLDYLNMDGEKFGLDRQTNAIGTERIIEICQSHDADRYLAGPSSKSYLDIDAMKKEGIEVEFHQPKYNLHTLDVLENYGLTTTRDILGGYND